MTEHEKAERRVVGRFAGNHMTTLRSALDPPALTCIHGGGARDRPMPQATTSTKKFDDIGDLGRIRFGGPEWVIK